jgi:hypothetical protein
MSFLWTWYKAASSDGDRYIDEIEISIVHIVTSQLRQKTEHK